MARNLRWDIEVEGIRPLLRELGTMGKDVGDEIRDESQEIAADLATRLRRTAWSGPTRQRQAIVHTVRARRDRVPTVRVGGRTTAAVSRPMQGRARGTASVQRRPTAGQMVRGVEFGARLGSWRFPYPYRTDGWWIGPAVRRMGPEMMRRWLVALDRVLDRGGRDG